MQLCCHSVDTGDMEVPDSKTESSSCERVAQQPEQRRQKVRRDISDEAAAPSSPVHSTLGQVRMERVVNTLCFAHFHPILVPPLYTTCVASSYFLDKQIGFSVFGL